MRDLPCVGLLVFNLGCAAENAIPDAGQCALPSRTPAPDVQTAAIDLAKRPASFDDLRYAPAVDRVLALPRGTGTLYLVDPVNDAVVAFGGLPGGVTSADATAQRIYLGDRGGSKVIVVDATDGTIVSTTKTTASPDYLRVAPGEHELWVTLPGEDRIAIYGLAGDEPLAQTGSVAVDGGPEGLVFDATHNRAYTHLFDGRLAVIDIQLRKTIAVWATGCAGAHGFPQVDEGRSLVIAGCASDGAAVVLDATGGTRLAGISTGGGESILAYSSALKHFYLRGDPSETLAIIKVCDSGTMTTIAEVPIGEHGHAMAADAEGHVWVGDAERGGLLRVGDPDFTR